MIDQSSPDIKAKLNSWEQSKEDFRTAWQLLRENFRAFISSELFALLIFIVYCVLFLAILVFLLLPGSLVFGDILPGSSNMNPGELLKIGQLVNFISSIFIAIGIAIFYGVMGSQYGLAYDIMSSGNLFAEFKGSFTYYRRFWWQYPIIMFLISGFVSLPSIQSQNAIIDDINDMGMWPSLILIVISIITGLILWSTIWTLTLPALTARGTLKQAFKENFELVRHYYIRIFRTIGLFSFIMYFGMMLIGFVIIVLLYIGRAQMLIPALLLLSGAVIVYFALYPMIPLMATRIYNSIILLPQKTEKKPE